MMDHLLTGRRDLTSWTRSFAQRALCAAAILLRPAAEMVRLLRVETDLDLLPRM